MRYIDSNIFLYPILYSDEKSIACKDILLKIAKGDISAATSFLSWDEIFFAIKKLVGRDIAVAESKKFLEFPNLSFVKVDWPIIARAQKIATTYELNPRDAIHAASALTSGCDSFMSDDSDFEKIKELKLIKP